MTSHTDLAIYVGVGLFLFIIFQLLIIKSRYKKFTSRYYVLRFRNGQLINQGLGGGYFVIPIIDELIVFDRSMKRVDFGVNQEIVFKPKFDVEEYDKKIDFVQLSGFLTYKIEDSVKFYQSSYQVGDYIDENNIEEATNQMLQDVINSHLQSVVLKEPLDKLYRNRSRLESTISDVITKYENDLGLNIVNILIKDFRFVTLDTN